MPSQTLPAVAPLPATRRLHPLPVRIMHWVNAIVMIIMILSGLGIYDDGVIFHFFYVWDGVKLGAWMPESIAYHFAFMWLLMANGAAYLVYGFVSRRFQERLFPIRWSEIVETVLETLRLHVAHEDLTVYNAVQKLLYIVVILAGTNQVVTGLTLWKPVQLSAVVAFAGGFQTVRVAHFLGMTIIVGFLVVHVVLALLVPRTLVAMVAGGPRLGPRHSLTGARVSSAR